MAESLFRTKMTEEETIARIRKNRGNYPLKDLFLLWAKLRPNSPAYDVLLEEMEEHMPASLLRETQRTNILAWLAIDFLDESGMEMLHAVCDLVKPVSLHIPFGWGGKSDKHVNLMLEGPSFRDDNGIHILLAFTYLNLEFGRQGFIAEVETELDILTPEDKIEKLRTQQRYSSSKGFYSQSGGYRPYMEGHDEYRDAVRNHSKRVLLLTKKAIEGT